MDAAISPYELAGRTPGAMASLLLCDQVVTLWPSPHDEPSQASTPRIHRVLESWAWTRGLWDEHVLTRSYHDDDPWHDVHNVNTRIAGDPSLATLAELIDSALYEDDDRLAEALAADLLRGGGDPRVSVPVNAGIDFFASRQGLFEFVSPVDALAARTEPRASKPILRVSLPIITQATGMALLAAREHLRTPLALLRRRFDELRGLLGSGAHAELATFARDRLEPAARDFEQQTLARRDELTDLIDRDVAVEPKLVHISLTGVLVDPAASLDAGAAVLRAVAGPKARTRQTQPTPATPSDMLALPRVLRLSVKALPWDA